MYIFFVRTDERGKSRFHNFVIRWTFIFEDLWKKDGEKDKIVGRKRAKMLILWVKVDRFFVTVSQLLTADREKEWRGSFFAASMNAYGV